MGATKKTNAKYRHGAKLNCAGANRRFLTDPQFQLCEMQTTPFARKP
jgi:hypothetical protein